MGDAGQTEREQGLLQMLVEMDGFRRNDRVLVIGATNRISMLDDALLRPGRFDKVIYMGKPPMRDRLKILQVSKGLRPPPPLPRSPPLLLGAPLHQQHMHALLSSTPAI